MPNSHGRSSMKEKIQKKERQLKKRKLVCLLLTGVLTWIGMFRMQTPVCAEETEESEESVVSELSLKNKTSVTIDTDDHMIRIIGTPGENYNVPIQINCDCTVILDNIYNYNNISVADGVTVSVILQGKNVLNHILAEGGEQTNVILKGSSKDDCLTVNDIACASSNHNNTGVSRTGANVQIENCTVDCRNLGCGAEGVDDSYWTGCDVIPVPRQGSNASPQIVIRGAKLSVSGNMACGGNGISKEGTTGGCASNGGAAGEVTIDNSCVDVLGDVSIGGTGGNGKTEGSGFKYAAGLNEGSRSVTICNQSKVYVTGNLATQPALPTDSNGSVQKGLDGVTVKVIDSELSAKDIASGGVGHERTMVAVYNSEIKDITGTAGGNGGTLIAQNAIIRCETAVCGANAGAYQFFPPDANGQKSTEADFTNHPLDGNGGSILGLHSDFMIEKYAAEKGNRWNNAVNNSRYQNSRLVGGTVNGSIYGDIITSDVTSILNGDLYAVTGVFNSNEERCYKCVLNAANTVSGQAVRVKANDLEGNVQLSETGTLTTWLSAGLQKVSIASDMYYFSGDIEVVTDGTANEFRLHPSVVHHIASGGAILQENTFTCNGKTYDYAGNFIVSGIGTEEKLVIESGEHVLTLSEAAFECLKIKGDANVKLYVDGTVDIQDVQVEDQATLTIANSEELSDHRCSLNIRTCDGVIKNNKGEQLYLIDFLFEAPGRYMLKLNEDTRLVDVGEELKLQLLLPKDSYACCIEKDDFCFKGIFPVENPCQIKQQELTLYLDCSKGDIVIDDHLVSLGEKSVATDANVCITQTDEAHTIEIRKKTAVVALEGVQKDVSVKLPSDFIGSIYDPTDKTSEKPGVSQSSGTVQANQTGVPSTGQTTQVGSSMSNQTNQAGASTSNQTKQEGNAAEDKKTDETSKTAEIKNQQKDQIQTTQTTQTPQTTATSQTNHIMDAPLQVETSIEGLKMVAADTYNTYQIFSKKEVSLTVKRMADTKYYYKILEKGQNNSEIKWRELSSEKITVQETKKGKRIMIKAINQNGTFIEKTMGFVIDTKKPVVKGIKNGAIYTKKQTIQVSDNCGSCEVRLNGIKIKRKCTIQKKGIYWLTALDKAGNKSTKLFAIL